jgi:hypothetical protein
MKRLISTIIFLFIIFSVLASQSGSRFQIDSTSIWRIDHIRNGVSDEDRHESGDDICKYFIHHDTIIGSHSYYQIFKTGISYLDIPFSYENVYMGALREEDNKFFFVKKKESKEILLYNFNAKIDDTIQVPYDGNFEEKIISSIDSLPDGRKLIHFNPKEPIIGCGDQYIIEGIGGSGGLLEGPACNHFWTADNHLVCYLQNGLLIYHDYNFNFNCEIIDHQNIESFIDSTCVWRVDKQINTDTLSDFEKLDYFICGDTVIQSKKYLKICKTGFQLYIDRNNQYSSRYNNSVYAGALRENGNKFYYIENMNEKEALLYNFNLEAGDVVDGQIFYSDTINGTGSILDNRKAFYLSDNRWEKFIIQGIGSDKGLLENKNENSFLICFMKNKAPFYHNGSGTECNLTFDDYNFSDCDKLKIIPENPFEGDNIQLITRICYTVSYDNPIYPTLANHRKNTEENSISIGFDYNYYDQNNSSIQKIVVPLFDTIDIGYLHSGDFFIDLTVNTIHDNSGNPYTVEYDKNLYLPFSVSQSNEVIINPLTENQVKVYPSPAKDFLIIESINADTKIYSYELYDILGSKVGNKTIENQSGKGLLKIDVSCLKKGIYVIRCNTGDSIFAQKIILD